MDWIIDISNILSEIGLSKHFNFVINNKIKNELYEIVIKDGIEVDGYLINDDKKILLNGKISYDYSTKCSRCLVDIDRKMTIELNEIIYSKDNQNKNLVDYTYENYKVNLLPIIRDCILLNLPYKVLCKDDCKGLCPICGTNLNKENCDCESENLDPRMAIFKDIKNDLEKE